MSPLLRKWIGLIALVIVLLSCVSHAHTLQLRLQNDPIGFDWNVATTPADTYLALNQMEGLVTFDEKLKVIPSLAQRWSVSPDHLTYTFQLDAKAKWSDGVPVTAQHFVDSWKRVLTAKTGSTYASFLFDVAGAENFYAGRSSDFAQVGVRALNASTLEVRLTNPNPFFLQMLTFWALFPVRNELIQKANWNKAGNLVVTGPYVVSEYSPQNQITLTPNKFYRKTPRFEKIIFRIVGDHLTAINLFHSKQLDFINGLDYQDTLNVPQSAVHFAPYLRATFLGRNTERTKDIPKEFWQDFFHSMDASFTRKMGQLFEQNKIAADNFLHPVLKLSFSSEIKRGTAKANSANHLRPLILLAEASDENRKLGEFLVQWAEKEHHVTIQLQLREFRSYRAQLRAGQCDLFIQKWGADYPDADSFYSLFHSASGNNFTRWQNTAYDQALKDSRNTYAADKRLKFFRVMEEILKQQDYVVRPLYFDQHSYLLKSGLTGLAPNPLNYVYLR